MNLKHFTVKAKLGLSFSLLAILVLLVSVMALHALGDNNENFNNYSLVNVAQAQLVTDVRGAVNRRAIAARNLILAATPADMAAEKQAVTLAHQDIQQLLATLNRRLSDPGTTPQERRLGDELIRVEARYGPVALNIVQLALDGKKDLATSLLNNECRPLLAALLKASNDYQQYSNALGMQSRETAAAEFVQARRWLISASLFAVFAAATLGILITRNLLVALGGEPSAAAAVAGAVAQGDLTRHIALRQGDKHSLMAQLSSMQASLRDVVSGVRASAQEVSVASSEIAQGNHELSGRTEHQASALQQTAASMEQLASTVNHNADAAMKASQLATTASAVAVRGGDVVSQVVETMQQINGSSKKISQIIGTIDSIAFQTNILALNAAVEAARAGDQGRGFAVVAGEVRRLAHQSAEAAKEIKALIESNVQGIEQGTVLAEGAGATMSEVVLAIARVSEIISAVSAASHEQAQGVEQVVEAVAQIDQVTQQNAALVEESAAAASSLSEQAEQLLEAVTVFKLDDATAHAYQTTDVHRGSSRVAQARAAMPATRPATRPTPRPALSIVANLNANASGI